MPGPMGRRGTTEKAKDFNGTLKRLLKSLGKYKVWITIVVVLAIASTIFGIISPKILGKATTEIFNGLVSKISGGSGIDFNKVLIILLKCLGACIASSLCSYIMSYIMAIITQKYTYKIRKDLSEKINRLPIRFFELKNNGEVLSIITNDVDTLSQNLHTSTTQLITSITTIIGVLIMMISINIPMSIAALIILPISGFLVSKVVKHSQKYFKKQQDYLGHVNGDVEEMLSGQNVVKLFNAEEKVLGKFNEDNKNLKDSAWKSQFLSGLMHPVMNFIGNVGYVVISIMGGYYCIQGKIAVGDIQSFISYVKNFTQPIGQIAQVFNQIQSMIAATERIFAFLDEKEETIDIKNPISTEGIEGNVEFKHVKFQYDNNPNPTIQDFSAKVKKGQKVAIVGPTGAGKTTMVKLLMRFYNVTDGEILLDGHNIQDFNRSELRHLFGMVLQDTWLFNGTIKENLRYGKLDATDDEVYKAAKTAYVDHFIKSLPDGYNMVLNEETDNISQGQKQLLTIARAIIADPKVLILDEATSSVDTRTEILIQKAMDELMKGRTSFIIAHRLSTIKNADLILVMNNGDIVETGTHEELLTKGGFYANLYNSQFEKIDDDVA